MPEMPCFTSYCQRALQSCHWRCFALWSTAPWKRCFSVKDADARHQLFCSSLHHETPRDIEHLVLWNISKEAVFLLQTWTPVFSLNRPFKAFAWISIRQNCALQTRVPLLDSLEHRTDPGWPESPSRPEMFYWQARSGPRPNATGLGRAQAVIHGPGH